MLHCAGKAAPMQKIALFTAQYPRWIALVAGAASATGFAPLNLWPLTLTCFALFIHLVAQAETGKRAALIGWLFGVGHFTISNNWIAVAFTFQAAMPIWLGYVAVVVLALYLAVYPMLCALGAWWIGKHGGGAPTESSAIVASAPPPPAVLPLPVPGRTSLAFILAFAGCWIITEWLRSWVFTGYVWNPLGVVALPTITAPAAWIGTYGLSGLVALVAGALTLLVAREWRKVAVAGSLLTAIWLMSFLTFWNESVVAGINGKIANSRPIVTVSQPNRPQNEKDAPRFEAINFAKLAMQSYPLPGQGPRLILWSEDAIPDYLEEGYPSRFYQFQPGGSALGARARLTTLMGKGDILLMGSNRLIIDKNGQLAAARNSMTAMDASGEILGHYDKAHLVPYGEYLPLKWLLTPLGLSRLVPGTVDFLPGPGPQTMTLSLGGKPVKVGLQICYEIIFSGQVIDRKNRPDFIFNPSNDSWFGTVGPPQFLAQARLRAIEEGLPVVRATPTGISAVIDADGGIVESLPHRTAGRIDVRLPVAKAPTLFARYGNILPVGFALLLIALALLPLARTHASR